MTGAATRTPRCWWSAQHRRATLLGLPVLARVAQRRFAESGLKVTRVVRALSPALELHA
ncbi:hypothetical protein ACSNOI_03525 [Actinomadura kijaniata]|uniref:hypothetical protein n=1 Tax=Actinomadura kijaniata TaxID=46161 RepID=UPI003F19746C